MKKCDADTLRLLTVSANAIAADEPVTEDIDQICDCGLIYSHTLSAAWGVEDEEPDIESIAAILRIGGTELQLPSYGCKVSSLSFDLPGLAVPSSAKLIAMPGFLVFWHVNYGNCK